MNYTPPTALLTITPRMICLLDHYALSYYGYTGERCGLYEWFERQVFDPTPVSGPQGFLQLGKAAIDAQGRFLRAIRAPRRPQDMP